jgi:hypothetical protein
MERPGWRPPQRTVAPAIASYCICSKSTANTLSQVVHPWVYKFRADRGIGCPAFRGVPLFLLFLQENNSERGCLAAGILDRVGPGNQNNSGTTAQVTQPIYLLRIFAKIAHQVESVKQIRFTQ